MIAAAAGYFFLQGSVGKQTDALIRRSAEPTAIPTPVQIPSVVSHSAKPIPYKGVTYGVDWFTVAPTEHVTLIPNFSDKRSSAKLIADAGCRKAVNGGFYTPDSRPLGMWKNDTQFIARPEVNPLLNGFFWYDGNEPHITETIPPDLARLAVQTGPLLVLNGAALPLRINNDRGARRAVAGIMKNKSAVFFMFSGADNAETTGPLLSDLPAITESAGTLLPSPIEFAINLDGGSASVFIADDFQYPEWKPVGSLFCIK